MPVVASITQTPVSRWDPIVASVGSIYGHLLIVLDVGSNRFTIYDGSRDEGDQWSPFFGDRSSLEMFESEIPEMIPTFSATVTILPNGGWSYASFVLRFNDSTTADPETFTLE